MSDAQPITRLRPGQVPKHVFVCGDPGRLERISKGWEECREICAVREYRVLAGRAAGLPVAAAAMTGSVYLITGVLFGGPVTGIPAAVLAGCFGWFWYGRPLLIHHHARTRGPTSSDTPGGSTGRADPDPRARDPRPRAPEHPSDTARAR